MLLLQLWRRSTKLESMLVTKRCIAGSSCSRNTVLDFQSNQKLKRAFKNIWSLLPECWCKMKNAAAQRRKAITPCEQSSAEAGQEQTASRPSEMRRHWGLRFWREPNKKIKRCPMEVIGSTGVLASISRVLFSWTVMQSTMLEIGY